MEEVKLYPIPDLDDDVAHAMTTEEMIADFFPEAYAQLPRLVARLTHSPLEVDLRFLRASERRCLFNKILSDLLAPFVGDQEA
jgi:hypothetical protein